MNTVHVFGSTGRFRSLEELPGYIDPEYTEDGDLIDSAFMREVGLDEYEPNCIEPAVSESGTPIPLAELLKDASYEDQWLPRLNGGMLADSAMCVFSPNTIESPQDGSLLYVGAIDHETVHPEWFQKLLRGECPRASRSADASSVRAILSP